MIPETPLNISAIYDNGMGLSPDRKQKLLLEQILFDDTIDS
jgi:hypothetical protein